MVLNTVVSRVRLVCLGLAILVALAIAAPTTLAIEPQATDTPVAASRISTADPLNGGYLIANMHGMLFHPDSNDVSEDLSYARWLGAGVIRVFATDSNGTHAWNGSQVGTRIADIAPLLRAAHLRLIVALVNNHQDVPGDISSDAGWMDNYMQLLLPFYTGNWRGAYHQFVHDLISTVQWYNAQDVIFAWELGNELHTPVQPNALIPFITQDATDVRGLDPITPILPGTMGANHVEPGNHNSSIARWLYCDAPVDAYTLHAYDWVSRQRPGDMPIDWDLDNILSQPCPNGRALPVIVEELGTSRALSGMYTADDETDRLAQERRQIEFVRHFPQVVGFGVWNAESPRLVDRTFVDVRRGLTSYGSLPPQGGGSCYDPTPDPTPGARCQLEQLLRGERFVRVAASNQWAASPLAQSSDALVGSVDPVYDGDADASSLTLTGWIADASAIDGTGVDGLDVYAGTDPSATTGPLTSARMGLKRDDVASSQGNVNWIDSGFAIDLPLDSMTPGPNLLTLAAHTPDGGMYLSTLAVVLPNLGAVPDRPVLTRIAPVPVAAPPPFRVEVESPQPGQRVSRTYIVEVLAPTADRVDVFIEPDRDQGGKLVGWMALTPGTPPPATFRVTVNLPQDAHTLYVHVSASVTGQQALVTVPVVVH